MNVNPKDTNSSIQPSNSSIQQSHTYGNSTASQAVALSLTVSNQISHGAVSSQRPLSVDGRVLAGRKTVAFNNEQPQDKVKLLLDVIKKKSPSFVIELQEYLENFNKTGVDVDFLLMFSVSSFISKVDKDVVKLLLKAGANVNTTNKVGTSPIMFASKNGHAKIVERLIATKADVNSVDNDGNTALILASRNGHKKIVKRLLATRADANSVDNDGNSALILASRNGHKKIVERLIAARVDANSVDNDGNSALILASRNGHKKIVERLIVARAYVHKANKSGNTALILASENGHKKIVKRLIATIAAANKVNKGGESLLWLAVLEDNVEIVKSLIVSGADANIENKNGNSPLWLAVIRNNIRNNIEIVKILIVAGADANKEDKYGISTFWLAIMRANVEIVKILIDSGADVTQKDKLGIEPIFSVLNRVNFSLRLNSYKTKEILDNTKIAILLLKAIPQQKLNNTIYLKILDAIAINANLISVQFSNEEIKKPTITLILLMYILLLQHTHLKLVKSQNETQENLLPTITRVDELISSLRNILVNAGEPDDRLLQKYVEHYLSNTPLPLSVLAQISASGALGINKDEKMISTLPIPKIMQTALLQECLDYL